MWTLLQQPSDWEQHRLDMAQQLKAVGVQLQWGRGPVEFPCLICSYLPDGSNHVASAYVYEADIQPFMAVLKSNVTAPVSSTGMDYYRRMTAFMLAIYDMGVRTGLFKEDQFMDLMLQLEGKIKLWGLEEHVEQLGHLKDARASVTAES